MPTLGDVWIEACGHVQWPKETSNEVDLLKGSWRSYSPNFTISDSLTSLLVTPLTNWTRKDVTLNHNLFIENVLSQTLGSS